jgi:hypothetical protein
LVWGQRFGVTPGLSAVIYLQALPGGIPPKPEVIKHKHSVLKPTSSLVYERITNTQYGLCAYKIGAGVQVQTTRVLFKVDLLEPNRSTLEKPVQFKLAKNLLTRIILPHPPPFRELINLVILPIEEEREQ